MRTAFAAVILSLALSGCGAKPAPTAAGPDGNSTAIAIAPDEEPAPSGQASGITAIDAATGDGQAMPADSTAPSAYDLAQRAERAKDREAERDTRAAAAPPVPPATLPGGDEAVTTATDPHAYARGPSSIQRSSRRSGRIQIHTIPATG